MRVVVDRWDGQSEIEVPASADVLVAQSRPEHAALPDPLSAVRQAVEHPYGMPPLADLVTPSTRVAIAFDDPLKYGPKYLTVPFLVDYLGRLGVPEENITLVCAGGTHDRPPREHFLGLYRGLFPVFAAEFLDRFWPQRFLVHDADDAKGLIDMGRSRLGDCVEHNRILADADLLIYTGSILPLIWGGYSGTGVVIGLGSARSIYSTHRFAVIGAPESTHSDPLTNLYQAHKEAIMARIEEFTGKRVFYLDGVPDPIGAWAGFFGGHFQALRGPAWACADQQHVQRTRQYEAIVVGVPRYIFYGDTRNPIINLMAAATVLRSWRRRPILKKGGVVIVVTPCDGHIDEEVHPSYPAALELFSKTRSAAETEKHLEGFLANDEYRRRYAHEHAYHGVHPFWLLNESQYALDHAGLVIFATGTSPEAAEAVGARYAADFEEAWRMAVAHCGRQPDTLVLPHYFSRVPMVFDVG